MRGLKVLVDSGGVGLAVLPELVDVTRIVVERAQDGVSEETPAPVGMVVVDPAIRGVGSLTLLQQRIEVFFQSGTISHAPDLQVIHLGADGIPPVTWDD